MSLRAYSTKERAASDAHGYASPRAASPIFGSGEMADRTRAFDWSRTPVGPIALWPETLLTLVNTILRSRHPLFLLWGPDLIQFYNDAYRPSIREDKHPRALGQKGRECWTEIWHLIGPQIDAVMSRGEASWNEDQLVPINRNGKLEDVYWTYGYSPVATPRATSAPLWLSAQTQPRPSWRASNCSASGSAWPTSSSRRPPFSRCSAD